MSNKSDLKRDYIFMNPIGSGSYGNVMSARHKPTGTTVAIKTMDKSAVKADETDIEVSALKALSHPNICQLYEVIETDEQLHLVMEYCSGGTLADYIKKEGTIPETEARRIFLQIVSAVSYIHEQEYAHCDIKPENIILTKDKQVKLIDFGFALKVGNGGHTSGTMFYMAPERLDLNAGKDLRKADVWSLGVVLYQMLSGNLPFTMSAFETILDLFRKIRNADYDTPFQCSTFVYILLKQLLEVNASNRITSQHLMRHAWVTMDKGSGEESEIVSIDRVNLDENCIQQIQKKLRLSPKQIKERLLEWKFDNVTASYLITLKEKKNSRPAWEEDSVPLSCICF